MPLLLLSPQGRAKPISVGPLDPLRSEAPELWRGASALISIGDQGAPVNVVSRARLITAGAPLRVATSWGPAHRHGTGTGQGAVIPGYSAIDGDPAGAFLVVFRLRPFGTSKDPIVCIQQGTSTAHLCYLRREADGQLKMFLRGGGTDYWGWTSTGWTTGELYAALITADSTGNRLWRNGRQVAPSYSSGSATSAQWLSSLPLADTWRLAAFSSPSQLVGDVELLHYAHWSRALTTVEAEAVSSDPWAMVRPRRTLMAVANGVTGTETHSGSVSVAAGARIAVAGEKRSGGGIDISVGAEIGVSAQKQASNGIAVTAGALLVATGSKHALGSVSVSAGARITVSGTAVEQHAGSVTVAAGVRLAVAGTKIAGTWVTVSGHLGIAVSAQKTTAGTVSVSTGVVLTVAARKTAYGTILVATGASITVRGPSHLLLLQRLELALTLDEPLELAPRLTDSIALNVRI